MTEKQYPNTKIKDILKERNLSLSEFAFKLRRPLATMSRIANGWHIPGKDFRKQIADELQVNESEIWQ